EHYVDRSVRDRALSKHAEDLADDRHARFVVAAEHGRAIAPHDVTVDDRLDALAGHHGVHVRGDEKRRRSRHGPGKESDQVAGVAADLLTRVVEEDTLRA